MEHERDRFLGCDPFQRTTTRKGYRNGFQERWRQTMVGMLKLRKPRVRGSAERFGTAVLDRYNRRQARVNQTVLDWLACGASTRSSPVFVTANYKMSFGYLRS